MGEPLSVRIVAAVLRNLGFLLFLVALAVAYRRVRAAGLAESAADIYWQEITLYAVGIGLLYYGTMHAFFQGIASRSIGWLPSPFEAELGFVEIAVGATAVLSRWRTADMRLAVTITFSIFSLAAAAQHVALMICCANFTPGNAGLILWFNDIALPIVLIVLAAKVVTGATLTSSSSGRSVQSPPTHDPSG